MIRLHEWRAVKERVKSARKILDDPAFKEMLAIVEAEGPLSGQRLGFGAVVTDGDRSRHLGRIEGYQEALDNLERLGTFAKPPQEPEVTYGSRD